MNREQIIRSLFGQTVHIVVDRPMGYTHHNTVYPINYGYIPGLIAGDGQPQDVYILGVTEPVSSFDGRIIGVIRRRDDVEDKLVAAPEGIRFHQVEIAEATAFQEQYFSTTVQSIFQKSCGVIPYRINGNIPEFLLLFQRFSETWSFPKGHIEIGETDTQTALRELKEESGLQAELLPDRKAIVEYSISPLIRKQVVLFLGRVQGDPLLQEQEILQYRWVTKNQLPQFLPKDTYQTVKQLIDETGDSLWQKPYAVTTP